MMIEAAGMLGDRLKIHYGDVELRIESGQESVSWKTTVGFIDFSSATGLRNRRLLNDTLVVWGGEFGRTPTAEGNNGREHHPFGFTMCMAGGGVRGGMVHGATDEFGWHSVDNKVHVHDLHATILHLMGLDHKRLTFRFGGRDYRLTDVHGHVVNEILA